MPGITAVILVALASLTSPPAGSPRNQARALVEAAGRSHAERPATVDESSPRFRDQTAEGCEAEDDDESPARPRAAIAHGTFVLSAVASRCRGASPHPAFHAIPRPRFLVCGRLTC